MQLRLPRRPRFLAAPQRPAERDAAQAVEEDDPWAGEDAAWTADDDLAHEPPGAFLRFFRGVGLAMLSGVVLWGLAVYALLAWLL
jgi:hypothetical protein